MMAGAPEAQPHGGAEGGASPPPLWSPATAGTTLAIQKGELAAGVAAMARQPLSAPMCPHSRRRRPQVGRGTVSAGWLMGSAVEPGRQSGRRRQWPGREDAAAILEGQIQPGRPVARANGTADGNVAAAGATPGPRVRPGEREAWGSLGPVLRALGVSPPQGTGRRGSVLGFAVPQSRRAEVPVARGPRRRNGADLDRGSRGGPCPFLRAGRSRRQTDLHKAPQAPRPAGRGPPGPSPADA